MFTHPAFDVNEIAPPQSSLVGPEWVIQILKVFDALIVLGSVYIRT